MPQRLEICVRWSSLHALISKYYLAATRTDDEDVRRLIAKDNLYTGAPFMTGFIGHERDRITSGASGILMFSSLR